MTSYTCLNKDDAILYILIQGVVLGCVDGDLGIGKEKAVESKLPCKFKLLKGLFSLRYLL